MAPLVTSPLGDRWASHVKSMVEAGAIGALVRELAMQAQCLSVEPHVDGPPNGELWRLRVERETLRAATNCDKLQAALTALLGFPVKLQVDSGATEDSPARRDAAERARRQSQAEETIHNDPLVLTLMQQYRTARIVPGSIKFH
jgi:DNA polymerase-3 subunit gamma/tau